MTLTHTQTYKCVVNWSRLDWSYKAKRSLVIKTLDIQCCTVNMEG